ncbi:glycosyltransferase family 2 protein [soil metagenome]
MKYLSIIIPIFNEEKYLSNFIELLMAHISALPEIHQAIFVNDGSTDSTKKILEAAKNHSKKTHVIHHSENKGKGEAMKTGLEYAKEYKSDGVIFMDGDGQHDPASIHEFIEQLKGWPIVFGYREQKQNTPLIRRKGNDIARFIIHNIFDIQRFGDILCGYFALRNDAFEKVIWSSSDYGVEAEISAIVGRKKIPFKEIKVKNIYLDNTKGVNLFDAVNILVRIPYWNFIYSHED